jgi:hypothetical protein
LFKQRDCISPTTTAVQPAQQLLLQVGLCSQLTCCRPHFRPQRNVSFGLPPHCSESTVKAQLYCVQQ